MARKGLFAALEDLEVEDSVVYGDTPYGEDIEQADSEARDELEEAEHNSKEIDELLDSTDEGIEDTETLQEMGGAIGNAADTEVGIDDVGIAPTIIATEMLCRNLNLENFKIMPALESFSSSNSRVQATKRAAIAIEGVVDKAIAKIKEVLKYIADKLAEFMDKSVEMYRKTMTAFKMKLAAHVKSMPDTAGNDIVSKGLVRAFGKPSDNEVTFNDVKAVLDAHMEIGKILTKISEETGPVCDSIIAAVKDSGQAIEEIGKVAAKKAERAFKGTLEGKRLVDGFHVEVTNDNGWGRPEFKSDWTGKEPSDESHIKSMSKSQVEEVLKQVETMMKDAIKESTSISKSYRAAHVKLDELDKLKDVEENRKKAGALAISKALKDFYAVGKEVYNLQNRSMKDALDYAKQSITSSKSKKKEEEKTK